MKQLLNPYKKSSTGTGTIMRDVIIALLPLSVMAFVAYDIRSVMVTGACVGASLLAELIFSAIFIPKTFPVRDGSAIITGLLLSFTLSPLTPWYIAAFGGAMAVLFGKILWGGIGKNRFNPALIGREFMVAFFPAVMDGADIWKTGIFIYRSQSDVVGIFKNVPASGTMASLIYNPSGALGEYSLLLLILGGLFLLFRHRISWHIPVSFWIVFCLLRLLLPEGEAMPYALGGVLLGVIYMATDMPSSPTHANGKLFYGAMMAVSVVILIRCGVRFAYMSYSILILNGFSSKINETLRPAPWGHPFEWRKRAEPVLVLALSVITVTAAVAAVSYYGYASYLVYLFIIYVLIKYYYSFQNKLANPI